MSGLVYVSFLFFIFASISSISSRRNSLAKENLTSLNLKNSSNFKNSSILETSGTISNSNLTILQPQKLKIHNSKRNNRDKRLHLHLSPRHHGNALSGNKRDRNLAYRWNHLKLKRRFKTLIKQVKKLNLNFDSFNVELEKLSKKTRFLKNRQKNQTENFLFDSKFVNELKILKEKIDKILPNDEKSIKNKGNQKNVSNFEQNLSNSKQNSSNSKRKNGGKSKKFEKNSNFHNRKRNRQEFYRKLKKPAKIIKIDVKKGEAGYYCNAHRDCKPGLCCQRLENSTSNPAQGNVSICAEYFLDAGKNCTNSCQCVRGLNCFRSRKEKLHYKNHTPSFIDFSQFNTTLQLKTDNNGMCKTPSTDDVHHGEYINGDNLTFYGPEKS